MRYTCGTRLKEQMRYRTAGDYYYVGNKHQGTMFVDVCKQKHPDYEFLILIHELIEQYLTESRGIPEQEIMDFDLKFEAERELGLHTEEEEPGDDEHSPYKEEHRFAENIERQIAHELGVNWKKYEDEIEF